MRPAGVLFAEDFDEPPPLRATRPAPPPAAPEPPPPPPPPDIAAIRRAAFEEGAASARAEIDAGAARDGEMTRRMLAEIANALGDAAMEHARLAEASAEAIARLALGMLAALLPALCERHGAAEVAALAGAVLPSLAHAPQVTIRVGPHAMAGLREELARLDPELRARIIVTPSDAIAQGDVRIAWQDGCAARHSAGLRQAILDTLAPLGLLPPMPASIATADPVAMPASRDATA
jgi:hypothetical protein